MYLFFPFAPVIIINTYVRDSNHIKLHTVSAGGNKTVVAVMYNKS